MKIYQVHRSGGKMGKWEDYGYIVASYLHEENAIKKKEELEEEQNKRIEQSKKCDECYSYYYYEDIGFEHCDEDCFIKALDYDGEIVCGNESLGYDYYNMENYFVETVEIEDA